MSQPDLLTQLRESRPMAPAEVREHVRQIAAQAREPEKRRTFNWRRTLVIAVPIAAAIAAGAVLSSGGRQQNERAISPPADLSPAQPLAPPKTQSGNGAAGTNVFAAGVPSSTAAPTLHSTSGAKFTEGQAASNTATIPSTNPNRVQRVTAELELRVPNTQSVSDGAKQAAAIARSLGGYPSKLDVNAVGRSGYAELVLRIPKQNLQKAVTRLSALGTIMGENVSIQDIQAQVDATTQKLARLQAQRAGWEAQPQTTETQQRIAALTNEIVRLRHGRTNTIRSASYATLGLEMTTRQAPAPLHHGKSHFHNLAVAFRWIGIGAVYALALGTPVVLLLGLVWLAARAVRRRREDALLSRP